ncbi:ATP-binding cassette, subfamily B [Amycolatopsis xylanica]|uniref:ATP-binding cassette, subfamily B n=1 Tax=Amycolatopsis xylanica TaxID=589385 RepID=A0A1H2U7L3_9PSEU|nr:ABC transporter ATP-binding protein [Amycolatopsis xylanica]SDW51947.1 ATP-binding cassette, subfamily B [Amycolatopsis xylanica]
MSIRLALFLGAHTAAYVLFVLSWVVLGRAAFAGGVDGADFAAWLGLLAGSALGHLLAVRLQSSIALRLGGSLRRRLVRGTLGLDPDELCDQGAGRLLGRVLEVEAVETLAIGGGLLGLVAGVELAIAAVALSTTSVVTTAALVIWVLATLVVAHRYVRARDRWTATRLELTDDLVAKMLGHRTRLAQQPHSDWHTGEETALGEYEARAQKTDRRMVVLSAVCTRGWVLVGVLGLWTSAGDLAAGAGGVLLAAAALRTLTSGLGNIADASAAWSTLKPLLRNKTGDPVASGADPVPGMPLLSADSVAFGYPGHPVLAEVDLRIEPGDRLLLDGPSGSGKSTLVAVLAGSRRPRQGTLLVRGRSVDEVGEQRWRRRVVLAPQFHENHLLLGTLAFNVLLGRGWPAKPQDLEDARAVCEDLGLGPLLDRMPSGLQQIVGETGWQLSHGERSLVFLARTLLQDADIVVLDETFGALDPATQHRALTAVDKAAPALLVVHHGPRPVFDRP